MRHLDPLLRLLLLSAALGCGTDPVAPLGTLVVATSTAGAGSDGDGYTVVVDKTAGRAIGANATLTISDLSVGVHRVALDGVASNCAVPDGVVREVTTESGGEASIDFRVTCTASTGSLKVVSITGGEAPDDGYVLVVDGGDEIPTGIRDSVVVPELLTGAHDVRLGGVPFNCAVSGGYTRRVEIAPLAETRVEFGVTCTASTGSLKVVAITGGEVPDNDYVLVVDEGAEIPLGNRDSVVVPDLPIGDHEVRLTGVAFNCIVLGGNTRRVTTSPGFEARVEFPVACAPLAGGATLVITLTTTVIAYPSLAGRFAIVLDGGPERPIPANGSITVSPLHAGAHRVRLKLPGSCIVGGFTGPDTNPQRVTLTDESVGFVRFTVLCIG